MYRRAVLPISRLHAIRFLVTRCPIRVRPTVCRRPAIAALKFYSTASTDGHKIPKEVTEMSMDIYHTRSNDFLDGLLDQLERLSDDYPDLIPDIELTQGVMTLMVPLVGTYVINKQPPNKQIWLSSPVSGPNRFDLVQGEWVSLRDGSKLLDVLNQELNEVITDEEVRLE